MFFRRVCAGIVEIEVFFVVFLISAVTKSFKTENFFSFLSISSISSLNISAVYMPSLKTFNKQKQIEKYTFPVVIS